MDTRCYCVITLTYFKLNIGDKDKCGKARYIDGTAPVPREGTKNLDSD